MAPLYRVARVSGSLRGAKTVAGALKSAFVDRSMGVA